MAARDAPNPHIDYTEFKINDVFDRMSQCLIERREVVITAYRKLKQEAARPPAVIQQNVKEVEASKLDYRIVFHSDTVQLEKLIAELGEVIEEKLTLPGYVDMKPDKVVRKSGTAKGELYSPRAVVVDHNNRIFVAEGNASDSHARISEFSERGDFLDSFTHQDMREPHGLATHGDYLYVTDTELHAIFQFKMEPQFSFVTKQGTMGPLLGHFNYPRNLAVSASGNVYLADCKNNRVQILNSSLHHLRTLTEQLILSPCDIKLTAEHLYVLCAENPCVLVFSYEGAKLRSLISTGYLMDVANPDYLCLDAAENILISDSSAHRIRIFSREGNLIKTVGEEGQQAGMLRHPTGLALTKELSLVVVSRNKNFAFQIFSS